MADQIDSLTGGGNLFTVSTFSDTSWTIACPTTSFDFYINGNLITTTTWPDGLFTQSLGTVTFYDDTSPATLQFVHPSTGVDSGGVYTDTFTITWSDPLAGYVQASEINTFILDWWNSEVRPELLAINTTLESILEQLTPTATVGDESAAAVLADQFTNIRSQLTPVTDEAQEENLADQIARLRYLADPNAAVVDDDENHGSGVRVSAPYSTVMNALTFDALINSGRILSTDNDINDETLQEFLTSLSNRNNSTTITESENRLNALVSNFKSNTAFNNNK